MQKNKVLFKDEALLCWILGLAFFFSVQTFFQFSAGKPILFIYGALTGYYLFKKSRFELPHVSTIFWMLSAGLLLWVLNSNYIPWRDNDAFMFWMPKAKALSLSGFLPAVNPENPQFTIHPDYPLGLVSFSAFVHSFLNGFSYKLHQLTLALTAICIWIGFFRLKDFITPQKKSLFFTWLFFGMTALQLPIWANGYHDILWASSFVLGVCYFICGAQPLRYMPYLILAALGKNEGLIFALALLPILAFKYKKKNLLWACAPPLLWCLVKWKFSWHSELLLKLNHPHPFFVVRDAFWNTFQDLLLFRTSHGTTSALLITSLCCFWKIPPKQRWLVIVSLGVYAMVYLHSELDPNWHFHFSLARVLLFPLLLINFLVWTRRHSTRG